VYVGRFFQTGYLPVGFELGAELTFPEPEGTSAGLLNGVVQIFGIVFTNAYSACFSAIGGLYSNLVLCAALAVGVVVTAFIKADLRRQKAQGPLSQAPTVAVIPKV
jgi:FLVCR family feline leukemia virus subgroup C receptor-related protein